MDTMARFNLLDTYRRLLAGSRPGFYVIDRNTKLIRGPFAAFYHAMDCVGEQDKSIVSEIVSRLDPGPKGEPESMTLFFLTHEEIINHFRDEGEATKNKKVSAPADKPAEAPKPSVKPMDQDIKFALSTAYGKLTEHFIDGYFVFDRQTNKAMERYDRCHDAILYVCRRLDYRPCKLDVVRVHHPEVMGHLVTCCVVQRTYEEILNFPKVNLASPPSDIEAAMSICEKERCEQKKSNPLLSEMARQLRAGEVWFPENRTFVHKAVEISLIESKDAMTPPKPTCAEEQHAAEAGIRHMLLDQAAASLRDAARDGKISYDVAVKKILALAEPSQRNSDIP